MFDLENPLLCALEGVLLACVDPNMPVECRSFPTCPNKIAALPLNLLLLASVSCWFSCAQCDLTLASWVTLLRPNSCHIV